MFTNNNLYLAIRNPFTRLSDTDSSGKASHVIMDQV